MRVGTDSRHERRVRTQTAPRRRTQAERAHTDGAGAHTTHIPGPGHRKSMAGARSWSVLCLCGAAYGGNAETGGADTIGRTRSGPPQSAFLPKPERRNAVIVEIRAPSAHFPGRLRLTRLSPAMDNPLGRHPVDISWAGCRATSGEVPLTAEGSGKRAKVRSCDWLEPSALLEVAQPRERVLIRPDAARAALSTSKLSPATSVAPTVPDPS